MPVVPRTWAVEENRCERRVGYSTVLPLPHRATRLRGTSIRVPVAAGHSAPRNLSSERRVKDLAHCRAVQYLKQMTKPAESSTLSKVRAKWGRHGVGESGSILIGVSFLAAYRRNQVEVSVGWAPGFLLVACGNGAGYRRA